MDLSFELIELKIKYYLMKSKYESLLKKLEKKRISKEQQKIIKMFHPVIDWTTQLKNMIIMKTLTSVNIESS